MRAINGVRHYRPMEIAELGLIQNSRGDQGTVAGHYMFILELIKSGQLVAKDYSVGGSKPYWLVSAEEIERYNAEANLVEHALHPNRGNK